MLSIKPKYMQLTSSNYWRSSDNIIRSEERRKMKYARIEFKFIFTSDSEKIYYIIQVMRAKAKVKQLQMNQRL